MRLRALARAEWSWQVEAIVCVALLSVLALAVFGPYVTSGGFLLDDWDLRSLYLYGEATFFGGVETFLDYPNIRQRPLSALHLSFVQSVFGGHMHWQLAWAAALGVFASAALYLLLRTVGLERRHAGVIAALLLIFPASSATRLWTAATTAQLALGVAMLGVAAALRGLDASGRASIRWHAAAVACYAVSLLTYELALGPILLAGLLYRARTTWPRALKRVAVDVGVALLIVMLFTRNSSFDKQPLDDAISHARVIADQAIDLFGSVVWPLGGGGYLALLPHLALLGVAIALLRTAPLESDLRRALRRWLTIVAAGLIVVVASYAVYVPASDFYVPLSPGLGDRTNAGAGIGFVLIVYGEAMLLATLIGRALPRARVPTYALGLVLVALVGIGYLDHLGDEKHAYRRAHEEGQRVLDVIRENVPPIGPDATLYSFGHALYDRPGVPIWAATWDLDAAVELMWDEPSLTALPAFPETIWTCTVNGLNVRGREGFYFDDPAGHFSPYGRTVFVDATSGEWIGLPDRRACIRATRGWEVNPVVGAPG